MCGRSTTHFSQMVDPCTDLSSNIPRKKNLGTVVAPLGGPRGEQMRSGGGFVGSIGFPRASFELRATHTKRASQFLLIHIIKYHHVTHVESFSYFVFTIVFSVFVFVFPCVSVIVFTRASVDIVPIMSFRKMYGYMGL